MLRVGVDVGGTNTDAVVMRGAELLAAMKTPTTADIESGVVAAIRGALAQARLPAASLDCVMIGTTQFTNAFIEGRRLAPIGMIRIALPSTTAIPPFFDWPAALKSKVNGAATTVAGGYEFDGRETAPLDEAAVREAACQFKRAGLQSVAISSVFAPLNSSMEQRAAKIVRAVMPEAAITQSHAFRRMGLIERENAAAMNASLVPLSRLVVASFVKALKSLDIEAPLYLSQNDGTLLQAEAVAAHPVLTFASGPTNSIRGAAFLTGKLDAIVIDIGGTTTDIGYLANGFPRESAIAVDIGGTRTNFRMPDILSLGLGGGSLVRHDGESLTVGPHSVAHRIRDEALVFGGETLTATDLAVAGGRCSIGDRGKVVHLPAALVARGLKVIDDLVAEGVDRMKTAATDMPVILVGGGAVLVSGGINGASEVHIPKHAGVANAVGAAIAQIGGELDTIFDYSGRDRDAVLTEAKAIASAQAIASGAAPEGIQVVEIEELPLNYMPGNRVRVRVKVVGDLISQRKRDHEIHQG